MSTFDLSSSWHAEHKNNPVVFVMGLSSDLSQADILSVFEQYGRVKEARLARDSESGRFLGHGFVEYENPLSAILAVDNLDRITLLNRTIKVSHARPKSQPDSKPNKPSIIDDIVK